MSNRDVHQIDLETTTDTGFRKVVSSMSCILRNKGSLSVIVYQAEIKHGGKRWHTKSSEIEIGADNVAKLREFLRVTPE